jgi:hypothetical protein
MFCGKTFAAAGSVADPYPGSGAFLTPGSGVGKKLGSGSEMNNPDYISESLETFFGFKYINSLMQIQDPGWKKFGSWIRDGKFESIFMKHKQAPT